MYIFLGFRFRRSRDQIGVLTRIRELCSPYIPPAYSPHALTWQDDDAQLAWLAWPKLRTNTTDPRDSRHKLLVNGYVTSYRGDNVAERVSAGLSVDGDHLTLAESTGGVSAFCYPDSARSRLYAWTTQPPAIGMYWAEDEEYAVVSTRPLLCQLAVIRSENLRLRSDYAALHLSGGCAIDGTTPYEGIRRLSVNRALCLSAEGVHEVPHPVRAPRTSTFSSGTSEQEKAEVFADALVRAVRPLSESPSVVLISGGKDSRVIAAAVTAAGASASAITFGAPDAAEVAITRRVAETLRMPLEVRQTPVYADPVEAARRSHMRTEGMVLSVPHQIRFADPLYSHLPVGHGHGHLVRGGFADSLETDTAKIRKEALRRLVNGWVKPEFSAPVQAVIEGWFSVRTVPPARSIISRLRRSARKRAHPSEALYWINHDLRLGPWSSPGQLEYDGLNRMCYPFLDERVVQITHSLSMEEKVSERVIFRVLRKLAPALIEIPIYRSMWRFEERGEIRGFEGRQRRVYQAPTIQSRSSGYRYIGDYKRHRRFDREVAEFILASRTYNHTLRQMLTSQVVEQIESYAQGRGETEHALRIHAGARRTLRRMLFHVFALSTFYDCSWLRPTAREQG